MEEMDLGCSTGGDIVNMTEEKNLANDCALGDSRLYGDLTRRLAL